MPLLFLRQNIFHLLIWSLSLEDPYNPRMMIQGHVQSQQQKDWSKISYIPALWSQAHPSPLSIKNPQIITLEFLASHVDFVELTHGDND